MRNARGLSRIGGATLAVLLTAGATSVMQAQSARQDGITVHGHWIIDIINPDGAVASHNEFENALEATGTTALSGVLARTFTPMAWQVQLLNATGEGACERSSAPPSTNPLSWIAIVEPGATLLVDGNPYLAPGGLTPGAPVFWNASPSLVRSFNLGEPVNIQLSAADNEGDVFMTFLGSGIPQGFAMSSLGAPNEYIQWDSSAAPPGVSEFFITLTDIAGHSNAYWVKVNLVAPPPPPPGNGEPIPCVAVEPSTSIPTEFANARFPTLAFAVVDDDPYHQHVEITGNVTATFPEPIAQVRSVLVMNNLATLPFSARTLDTPIQVVAGQKIYVRVNLSFQ